jgi:hypothetical protein
MKLGSLVSLASLLLAVACGGSDRSVGVDSTSGATVEGALHTSGASSSGLRVSVQPAGPSTATDDSGHFLLEGVPAGSVGLRFEGPGFVAAVLQLGVVADGMEIVLDVRLSSGQAEAHAEVEFKGVIESIDPAHNKLKVSGVTVTTSASTEIERTDQHIALSDLKVGERVRVEGTPQADGTVAAKEIEVVPAAREREVELEGIVESVDVAKSSLKVSGHTVITTPTTLIRRGDEVIALKDVKAGDRVHVRGKLQADGSILARIIRVAPGFLPRVVLEGIIESVDTAKNTLKVSGLTVVTDANTRIVRAHQAIMLKDLKVGERVHVRGTPQTNGTILAIVIGAQGAQDHG